MGDLASLYSQAKKQSLWLNEGLKKLEEAEAGSRHGDPAALARDLINKLADLQKLSQELQNAWRMYGIRGSQTERAVWSRKVEQVLADVQEGRRVLDRYSSREQRRQAEREEREELFARAAAGRQAKDDMDAESQIETSVNQSHRELDRIYEAGKNILSTMSANKEILKSAQRKMLDVLNSVNLGTTLLKLIERRQRMDIWLTYGGMVLMLLIVGGLMWFMWT